MTAGPSLIALILMAALPTTGNSTARAGENGLADLSPIAPVAECTVLENAATANALSVAVGARVSIQSALSHAGADPYCGVRGTIAPHIGFEVRLPVQGWTQRYLQLGCGGLCGIIAIRPEHASECTPLTSGAIVLASTDMGHEGSMGDAAWGDVPQARQDFAWRGVHLTAAAAKALIARYYGRPARYAYFSGCSDGGREALMEAQRFPDDFDGISAGAPAMNFQVQNTFYHGWQALSNHGPDGRALLTAAKLPVLHRAALAACDALDGLKDGQITDPRACRFDPATAGCRSSQSPSDDCLTAAEVEAARRLYQGPRDEAGHRFTIGGPQVGSELAWRGVYVPETPNGQVMSPMAAMGTITHLAFPQNPPANYRLEDFRFDVATFDRLAALHTLYDATDEDLGAFQKHGGRLLLWHGWSDPHISPINTIAYYEGVEAFLGREQTMGFARLFLFPGLYHCGGGDGPAEFDVLTPLMAWVESGQAPERIVAGRAVGGAAFGPPAGPPPGARPGGPDRRLADRLLPVDMAPAKPLQLDRTRPVFPYPQVARYSSRGSVDDASNFVAAQGATSAPASLDWQGAPFMRPDIPR